MFNKIYKKYMDEDYIVSDNCMRYRICKDICTVRNIGIINEIPNFSIIANRVLPVFNIVLKKQ
jgi:hypothetical protein